MTEALYEALDQQIVLGKNRKLSLDQAKAENADGIFEMNALSMLEKYCQEKYLAKIKKELARLLTDWNQEDRSQLWTLRMLHRIAYLLQKYRVSVVRSIQQEESMLEEACFYAENLEQFVKNIMDVFFEDFTDLYDTPEAGHRGILSGDPAIYEGTHGGTTDFADDLQKPGGIADLFKRNPEKIRE